MVEASEGIDLPPEAMADTGLLEALIDCVDKLKTHDFYAALINLLRQRAAVDFPQIWLFQSGRVPVVLFHLFDGADAEAHVTDYIDGAYAGDPCYQAWSDDAGGSEGAYRITELSRETPVQRDYMQGYFSHMRVHDEAGCLVQLDSDTAVNISVMRGLESPRFDEAAIARLHAVIPLVRALLRKHWALNEHRIDEHSLMTESVQQAMKLFGSTVLTLREHAVAYELLQGYSTQSIAERLGISPETLRNHRKSIYRKLDINSQPELFTLFIHSLPYTTQHPNQDPLLHYLSVPVR